MGIREWHTARLTIRRLREEDLEGLWELHSDPEATRYIGGVWTREETREILGMILGNDAEELEWRAVVDRSDGTFIGVCWLGQLASRWCEALGVGPQVELGYRYCRRQWGKGYATEAGAAMLRRGFEELGLGEIISIVDACNVASERVINKLGFAYERSVEAYGITIRCYRMSGERYARGRAVG